MSSLRVASISFLFWCCSSRFSRDTCHQSGTAILAGSMTPNERTTPFIIKPQDANIPLDFHQTSGGEPNQLLILQLRISLSTGIVCTQNWPLSQRPVYFQRKIRVRKKTMKITGITPLSIGEKAFATDCDSLSTTTLSSWRTSARRSPLAGERVAAQRRSPASGLLRLAEQALMRR